MLSLTEGGESWVCIPGQINERPDPHIINHRERLPPSLCHCQGNVPNTHNLNFCLVIGLLWLLRLWDLC